MSRWRADARLRTAVLGGGGTAVAAFAALATVGSVSPFEAIALLEAVVPTLRFLGSATLTGGITMLALMLTLLTFTASHTEDFTDVHYLRIRQVSTLDAALIILSMVLLMLLSVPLDESDTFRRLYTWVYYGVGLLMSLLGGLLIAIVVMVQTTIRDLLHALHPRRESALIHSRDRGEASDV